MGCSNKCLDLDFLGYGFGCCFVGVFLLGFVVIGFALSCGLGGRLFCVRFWVVIYVAMFWVVVGGIVSWSFCCW